jgi:hypothetical protein
MTGSESRVFRHGTTRKRAEAILNNGPDPYFIEPGGLKPEKAFSVAPGEGPFPVGTPEVYAKNKAALFPNEGGPAIVEMVIPKEIVELGDDTGGEIRFYLEDGGLQELIAAWPALEKRIILI